MPPTDPRIICVNMLDDNRVVVDLDDKRGLVLSLEQMPSLNRIRIARSNIKFN